MQSGYSEACGCYSGQLKLMKYSIKVISQVCKSTREMHPIRLLR